MSTKLIEVKKIKGQILVETGLHIGDSNETVEIGGCDSPVIRNPKTMEPYIPGSSLKGKMRALLEMKNGHFDEKGASKACENENCKICRIFGVAADPKKDALSLKRKPTRIIVRDSFLSKEFMEYFRSGKEITEVKTENGINRITSAANPRKIERVIPGTGFDFEILLRVYQDDEENLIDTVYEAMELLQNDSLGGGGSRGNGKISFRNVTCNDEAVSRFRTEN